MRIAFERAGGSCIYSNEWNKYSQQTYFANFGELPEGDITQVKAADIPDHDILVAGFPCQPFSIAGVSKKNSMGRATGFEDKTQGTLFFDVCRILARMRVFKPTPTVTHLLQQGHTYSNSAIPWAQHIQIITQTICFVF